MSLNFLKFSTTSKKIKKNKMKVKMQNIQNLMKQNKKLASNTEFEYKNARN